MVGGRLLLLVLVLVALAAILAASLATADPYVCEYQGENYTRAGAIQAQPIGPAFETCRETQGQIKTRSYPLGFSGSDSASGRGDLMTVQRSVGFSADVGGEGWAEYSYSLSWVFSVEGAPEWSGRISDSKLIGLSGAFVLDWGKDDPQPRCIQGCPGDKCMGYVVWGSTLSASAATSGSLKVKVSKGYFGPSLALVAGAVLWTKEGPGQNPPPPSGCPWTLVLEATSDIDVKVGDSVYHLAPGAGKKITYQNPGCKLGKTWTIPVEPLATAKTEISKILA